MVVSEIFEGVKSIDRHRKINSILNEELGSGVHALSIVAKTPKQWQDSGENPGKSPPCRGGRAGRQVDNQVGRVRMPVGTTCVALFDLNLESVGLWINRY